MTSLQDQNTLLAPSKVDRVDFEQGIGLFGKGSASGVVTRSSALVHCAHNVFLQHPHALIWLCTSHSRPPRLCFSSFGNTLDSIVSIMMKDITIQVGYVSVSFLGLSFDLAGLWENRVIRGFKVKASGKETNCRY